MKNKNNIYASYYDNINMLVSNIAERFGKKYIVRAHRCTSGEKDIVRTHRRTSGEKDIVRAHRCTSEENNHCLHAWHNQFKLKLGRLFGEKTYTVKDNDQIINEYILWKNKISGEIEKSDGISWFIEVNNKYEKSTVFFKNHWKYTLFIYNSVFACAYFVAFKGFPPELIFVIASAHVLGLLNVLAICSKTLTTLAKLRGKYETILILNKKTFTHRKQYSKENKN